MARSGTDTMALRMMTGLLVSQLSGSLAPTAAASEPVPTARFVPIDFHAVPGWSTDNHASAFAAFRRSCPAILAQRSSASAALADVCRLALNRGSRRVGRNEARIFFEHAFRPHRVVHAANAGLLTGYYEPHIDGSRTRTARFSVPIYRRPPDLVNVVAETERAAIGVAYTHLRRTPDGLEPYSTRTEIEAGVLTGKGLELVWLADPVDVFFAQVQGSARIRFADGTTMAIGYDGKNGHPYTSIGRVLIDQGAMRADSMSMATLGAYLRADARRGREVMQHNASYVFFRQLPPKTPASDVAGPHGALGTPLTPGRSLAVDTTFHALGTPVFVEAASLTHWGARKPFRRLMIAQDVGSAICGAERGDIYFGSGDRAGAIAGVTKHSGRFYILLPRAGIKPR